MHPFKTFVLGTTLALGTVVGLAPFAQAAPTPAGGKIAVETPNQHGPVLGGGTIDVPPVSIPGKPPIKVDPCKIVLCDPPVRIDPCVLHPDAKGCTPKPEDPKTPEDPKKPEDPKPETPKQPQPKPPTKVDEVVKGRPVFTG